MALVKLKLASGMGDTRVYINPDQVIALMGFKDTTNVYVATVRQDNQPMYYSVEGDIDEIAAALGA